MATSRSSDTSFVTKALDEKVRHEIGLIFDKQKAKMMTEFEKALEKERTKLIASVVMKFSRTVDIVSQGEKITLTVKREDLEDGLQRY